MTYANVKEYLTTYELFNLEEKVLKRIATPKQIEKLVAEGFYTTQVWMQGNSKNWLGVPVKHYIHKV